MFGFSTFMRMRPRLFRPVFRFAVILRPSGQNAFVTLHLPFHISGVRFGRLRPAIRVFPRFQNHSISCAQILLRFILHAQRAGLPNLLHRKTAPAQALNTLHSVDWSNCLCNGDSFPDIKTDALRTSVLHLIHFFHVCSSIIFCSSRVGKTCRLSLLTPSAPCTLRPAQRSPWRNPPDSWRSC